MNDTPLLPRIPSASKSVSVLSFFVFTLLAVLSYWSANECISSSMWRDHTSRAIADIRGLRMSLHDAEASLHSYVITNKSELLISYERAKIATNDRLGLVRGLLSDNIEQSHRLDRATEVLRQNLVFLDAMVEVLQLQGQKKVLAMMSEGHGQQLASQLRAAFDEMEAVENQLLDQRVEKSERAFMLMSLVLTICFLFALALLLLLNHNLRKEMRCRKEIEDQWVIAYKKSIEQAHQKSCFFTDMGHNLHDSLNGIMGVSKLLSQTELSARQADYVDSILNSSQALLSTLNNIPDLNQTK